MKSIQTKEINRYCTVLELPRNAEILSVQSIEYGNFLVSYLFDSTVGLEVETRSIIIAQNGMIILY